MTEIGSRHGFIVIGGKDSQSNPLADVWVRDQPSSIQGDLIDIHSCRNMTLLINSGHKFPLRLEARQLDGVHPAVLIYVQCLFRIPSYPDQIIPSISQEDSMAIAQTPFLMYGD